MKIGIVLWACVSLAAVLPLAAQTKSVTNADLEKFRQKRLQAERDYRENYARLGFPSPEELDRQREQDRIERDALSARLASERIQREQLAARRAEAEALYRERTAYYSVQYQGIDPYFGFPNYVYQGGRVWRPGRWNSNYQFPVRVGNGIPIINYDPRPQVRVPVFQTSRWRRH